MAQREGPGFDRLRPRSAHYVDQPVVIGDTVPDQEGKRALFSAADQPASTGAVTIDCSACGARSVVSVRQAVRLAVPSLHVPVLRRGHASWMRCPACRRRSWVRLEIQLP